MRLPLSKVRSTISLLTLAASLNGCATLSYLSQASHGQREIILAARPIEDAVKDPEVPLPTRELLAEVARIKSFGERQGLSPTKNYARYVDLHRRFVVWVVTACAPLAFQPKVWSFPIVGGVTYLGWFRKRDAASHAQELRDAGWDVDMRGSTAYSTLGWFSDPVLSTMLGIGPAAIGELAETVLHESLHATLYVKNQSPFDESIATWFGDRLGDAYLVETRGEGSAEILAFRAWQRDSERRAGILHEGYAELAKLYASGMPKAQMLEQKQAILAALGKRVGATRPLTNATLVGFRTYHAGVAELDTLHASCGGSFPRTLATIRKRAASALTRPQEEDIAGVVRQIADGGCVE